MTDIVLMLVSAGSLEDAEKRTSWAYFLLLYRVTMRPMGSKLKRTMYERINWIPLHGRLPSHSSMQWHRRLQWSYTISAAIALASTDPGAKLTNKNTRQGPTSWQCFWLLVFERGRLFMSFRLGRTLFRHRLPLLSPHHFRQLWGFDDCLIGDNPFQESKHGVTWKWLVDCQSEALPKRRSMRQCIVVSPLPNIEFRFKEHRLQLNPRDHTQRNVAQRNVAYMLSPLTKHCSLSQSSAVRQDKTRRACMAVAVVNMKQDAEGILLSIGQPTELSTENIGEDA